VNWGQKGLVPEYCFEEYQGGYLNRNCPTRKGIGQFLMVQKGMAQTNRHWPARFSHVVRSWRRAADGLFETGIPSKLGCFTTAGQIQLGQNARNVALNGIFGEEKSSSDFLIGCAASQFSKDFQLSWCKAE